PEKDHKAGKLDKAEIVFGVVFIADDQTAKVVQPGKESFNFPTTLAAMQRTSILSRSLRLTILPMWSNHLRPELIHYFTVQCVTVVSFVANQPPRHISDKSLLERLVDQFYFSWASTGCAYGERKTIPVCNCHDLGALSAL